MIGRNYKEWVKTLKEGGLVLSIEGRWSAPVLFLSWNGDSATNGYRAQHLYIPTWDIDSWHFKISTDAATAVEEQYKSTITELEKHGAKSRSFTITSVNTRAEEHYFPFPVELLTSNQVKFIKLINKIKKYEY